MNPRTTSRPGIRTSTRSQRSGSTTRHSSSSAIRASRIDAPTAASLPFADGSFDVVHSSAVLEHVGSFANQRHFVEELTRVARRVVFLTTPNRWFPVEFHTVLPLVHWLPKPTFRRLLGRTRYRFFALEENLNLLDSSELRQICAGLRVKRARVESQRLLGLASNLLVTIEKDSPRAGAASTAP